jgi:hypothetical protein
MYIVTFHPIFNENANILSQRLGIPIIQEMTPKKDDIVIVFGAHEQADKLVFIQQVLNVKYIIIQSEQFESKVFDNKYYMELIQNNPVLDWSISNVERFKSKLNMKFFGLYFYDFFFIESDKKFEDREIDFFFTGAYSKEREKVLNEFMAKNSNYKFEIDFSYNYKNPIDLTNKLKNVKYVINIPFYKGNVLETHRINKALSLGCEVVSLYSSDQNMNKKYDSYVHFVNDLNEFSLLFELEKKSNYVKLMEEFGKRDIENCLKSILFAEKTIIEFRETKDSSNQNMTKPIQSTTQFQQIIQDTKKSIQQPPHTDFAKFLEQKKLNEKLNK